MAIDVRDKKFLVIDDMPEFRLSIKQIIQEMGGKEVKQCSTGEQAIAMIEEEQFDYIFSDYNIPGGRTGQQVLEELMHRKLLKTNMIYVMITGESAYDMVMAALECYPDIYLTKPVSTKNLMERVAKVLIKKKGLYQVGLAIDADKYEIADKLLDNILAQKKVPYLVEAYRLKIKVCFQLGKHKQVLKIAEKLLEFREIPWGRLAIGKAYFFMQDFKKAKTEFENLFEQNVAYVEAGDWLAKTLLKLGEDTAAQETLSNACDQSPRGIQRQQMLARVAHKNGDKDAAIKAYKMASNLGQHSIHKDPNDYVQYTEYLIEEMIQHEGLLSKRDYQAASRVIDKMIEDFKHNPPALIKAYFQKMRLCESHGIDNEAELAKLTAERYVKKNWSELEGIEKAEIAAIFYEYDLKESALQYGLDVLWEYRDDEEVVSIIREFYTGPIVDMKERKEKQESIKNNVSQLNVVGVDAFKKGRIDKAMDVFTKAYREMIIGQEEYGAEININACLNAAHALLTWMDRHEISLKELKTAEEYLSRCANLSRADARFGRYYELQNLFDKISTEFEEANANVKGKKK